MSRIRMTTKESGFTIVELLIYMVMFVVVLGAMYSIMISNTRSYSSQENRVEMTQDLRAAMNLMVREIRMAGCDPEDIDTVGFVDGGDDDHDTDGNSINFTMDISDTVGTGDPDGFTDGPNEEVNYRLDATTLKRTARSIGGGALTEETVAENITVLTFNYRFADGHEGLPGVIGDGTDDLEDIRRVQISITGETATEDAVTGTEATRTQTSWVVVRNAGVD